MTARAILINRTQDAQPARARLAGLPLLLRALLTAQRAGIEEALIVGGSDPGPVLRRSRQLKLAWRWIPDDESDSGGELSALARLAGDGGDDFALLFADSVFDAQALRSLRGASLDGQLLRQAVSPDGGDGPAANSLYLCSRRLVAWLNAARQSGKFPQQTESLLRELSAEDKAGPVEVPGLVWRRTTDGERLREIERTLVRLSLKRSDGIYARFNKLVVARLLIAAFLRTPATPNFITALGVLIAIGSAAAFLQGSYAWSLAGAVLAYLSALMDHVDGMVARLKFQESDFGTWFETAGDFASYLLIFTGLAGGLYRETGDAFHLIVGCLFVIGTLMSFITTSWQRKLASADKPADYANRFYAKLEERQDNFFHWFSRKCSFLTRRAVLPYFIFFFCLLNLRVLLLDWVAFGANVVWIITLYNNRLFRGRVSAKLERSSG
jgi:phosphatidylglycerophosphate synthase